ncbi:hypothetical protein AG1IA_00629 [Rhizoctonia solani AG-1 IA]|uniref:Uncharacterized protein n=1 Tax=Thanatephorus cucumeris (strain AG1-IA) TaxID=983506 RepID=L8X4X5_THACA|nr:hypothetical protein AG1IA_00629 [Rhizoctonia solani AG-1 IA]
MEVAANLRGRQADELTSTPRLAKVLNIPGLDNLRTYYAATMALVQGSPARPGLPPELVIYICRLADFEVVRITKSPEGIKEVRAWSPKIESRLWFQTKPMKKPILSRIKSIQLITMSRHQGWVNNRSGDPWSWFEVRIACPGDENPSQFEAKLRGDGYDASWRSHSNPVEQEASSQEIEFTEHRGLLFGTDNQLWHEIKEGDVLQVVLKAQFSGCANIASDGALKIVTWWEPSPEMLDLLYNRCKPLVAAILFSASSLSSVPRAMSDTDNINSWSSHSSSPQLREGALLSHPQLNPDVIKSYYTAFAGLLNGSSNRQALPLKLVLHICRLAAFERWLTIRAPEGRKVQTWGSEVKSVVWFQSRPFTSQMLRGTKSVQLVTMSRHQGWVGDRNVTKKAGSWSWFEVRVAQPVDKGDTNRSEVKRHLDGSEMSWRSHAHPVDQETAQQQGNFAEHKGLVFDSDHELWDEVGEGDVLQVVMKVQFRGWANKASDGMLQISTWWEPSAEMLDMMGQSGKI